MGNKDIIISLMIMVTSLIALFVPLPLFYMIAIGSILLACILLYSRLKEEVCEKLSFWQIVAAGLTGLLAYIIDDKISISFYFISTFMFIWFALYNIMHLFHSGQNEDITKDEVKKIVDTEVNKIKDDMKQWDHEYQRIKSEKDEANKKLKESSDKLERLEEQLEKNKNLLEVERNKCQEAEQVKAELVSKKSRIEDELKSADIKIKAMESKLKTTTGKNEETQEGSLRLLEEERAKQTSLVKELEEIRVSQVEQERLIDFASQEIKQKEQEIQALKAKNDQLKIEKQQLYKKAESEDRKLKDILSEVNKLNKENEKYKEENSRLMEELTQINQKLEDEYKKKNGSVSIIEDNQIIKNTIYNAIDSVEKIIHISIYDISDYELLDKLEYMSMKGIEIKIITDYDKIMANFDQCKETTSSSSQNHYGYETIRRIKNCFKQKNVTVKLFGKDINAINHQKKIIIDEKYLISGSANFTKRAFNANKETVFFVKDLKLIQQGINSFNKLFNSNEVVLFDKRQLN